MLAPSLPLLLTELVAAPSPSLPHHTHYTIALAFVTPTRPPNYLPAYPDDARRTARTRVASAPLRSARRKSTVAPECVERWERAVRRHSFGYANSHTGIELSYLPASPGDVRRSPHVSLLATLSLSSTTSNGSWVGARAPRSHTTHTTRHNFGYRNTLTATKLPACIHCRCSSKRAHPIGAAHLRSLLLKDLQCSTLVPRTRTRHTRLYLRLSL